MHKDWWFSSRCGRGAWRVKNRWLSSGSAAFSRSQFADPRRGLSQAGGRGPRSTHSTTSGYRPPASPALRPRARLLPPRPPGGGPDHQAAAGVEGAHLERCEPGGDVSGFWAERASPNPPAGPEWTAGRGSKVQGTKTAPGRRQTRAGWPAQATNPAQPRAAGPARAAANRNRARASDRPGLGTCGERAGSAPGRRTLDWLLGLAPPPPIDGSSFFPPPTTRADVVGRLASL